MGYTYPLTMPTTPKPEEILHRLIRIQAKSISPYTGASQTYAHQGAYWQFQLNYPTMTQTNINAWIAFLLKLKGMVGTFYFSDPDPLLGNIYTSTPIVAAGGFDSDMCSVETSGWTASKTGLLLPGDWISFSNYEYKRVTTQVDSDGSGNATIYFEPRQRTVVSASTAIATGTSAKGIFKLSDPNIEYSSNELKYGKISLSIVEAIT